MKIQTEPLDDYVQYFMEAASECGEVTFIGSIVPTLYGDRALLREIVYREDRRKTFRDRQSIAMELEKYGVELAKNLPPARRKTIMIHGLGSLRYHVRMICNHIADWNYFDETVGGCLDDFRRIKRIDRFRQPTPRARRKLHSPKAIRRRLSKHDEELHHMRRLFELVTSIDAVSLAEAEPVEELWEDLERQRQADRNRRVLAMRRPGIKPRPRQPKSTKRAALFAASLLGAAAVSSFARGEEVMLPADDLTLGVKLSRSIHSMGHGAVEVRLREPGGDLVSHLCVYQDATPALDQLASIAMHVATGDAQHIVRTGNLYGINKPDSPLIAGRIKPPPAGHDPQDALQVFGSDYQRDRLLVAAYQRDMAQVYLDAVTVAVFGRDAKHLLPSVGDGPGIFGEGET